MKKIGIFDNTNYNYIINYIRDVHKINIVNDFKLYNAFSIKNISNLYDALLILSNMNVQNKEKLKHVIMKSKTVFVNSEDKVLYGLLNTLVLDDITIYSYGFNDEATFSITEIDQLENIVTCKLNNNIVSIYGKRIPAFEISISKGKSIFSNNKLLGIISLMIFLGYLK